MTAYQLVASDEDMKRSITMTEKFLNRIREGEGGGEGESEKEGGQRTKEIHVHNDNYYTLLDSSIS